MVKAVKLRIYGCPLTLQLGPPFFRVVGSPEGQVLEGLDRKSVV